MNKLTQITSLLIAMVILCSFLIIGGVWGIYFFDHAVPESSLPSDDTASSSSSESTGQTENTVPPNDKPKKMIAITFDDGPSVYTHQILDLLEQYQAKATFFVCGYRLNESTKDELQRAISLGCEIGNHSDTHETYLTKLSEEELLNEIRNTNEKIAQYSGVNYNCSVYRPPWGEINRNVVDVLLENEIYMYPILWSVDSLDWSYKSQYSKGQITWDQAVQGTFDTVVKDTEEGSVILMHDIQSITPDVVARILEKYTAEGYTFVTVSELFGFEENSDTEAYYNRYRSTNSIKSMN